MCSLWWHESTTPHNLDNGLIPFYSGNARPDDFLRLATPLHQTGGMLSHVAVELCSLACLLTSAGICGVTLPFIPVFFGVLRLFDQGDDVIFESCRSLLKQEFERHGRRLCGSCLSDVAARSSNVAVGCAFGR